MNRSKFEKFFTEWIDAGAGTEASRALGSTIDDIKEDNEVYHQVVEITINVPQKKLSTYDHCNAYLLLWDALKLKYKPIADSFFIEQCKSGQFHIHGYLKIPLPISVYCYDDKFLMDDISRTVFKNLPSIYWKQRSRAIIDSSLRRYKTPALCLNLKNILYDGWLKYISKDANAVRSNVK